MSWTVELKPTAEKQYLKPDKKMRQRIKKRLEKKDKPLFHHDGRALTVPLKGDYRLKIGQFSPLFATEKEIKFDLYQ
ncbi:MAG: hypothetical protein IEMM0008_1387 [bacterium]|nr:MAG: hypothetical protein IEMM0008_1387 [bacterium]